MKRMLVSLIAISMLLAACSTPAAPVIIPTEIPPTQVPPTQVPPTPTHIPVDIPVAARAAINALAEALGLSADQIKLISVEAIDWPDACLGVVRMGVLCAQGVTPGFRVLLEANGQTYEYHTNQDGSVVAQAVVNSGEPAEAAEQAALMALAKALGIDPSEIKVILRNPIEWPDSCLGLGAPNESCLAEITPGFVIVLEANGKQYEYHTNQDGTVVKPGLTTLAWHREGGIAGFCDDLLIYQSGELLAANCGTGTLKQGSLSANLSADEVAQLNEWLSKFGAVAVTRADDAVADAMTVTLSLQGVGAAQPSEAEQQQMMEWAQSVYAKLQG